MKGQNSRTFKDFSRT